jgi:hypothetical protein
MFLSALNCNSSIFQFSLFPFIQFEKQWSFFETPTENQIITNTVYKNETLTLAPIHSCKEERLIELRSSAALKRFWSFKLDVEYSLGLLGVVFLVMIGGWCGITPSHTFYILLKMENCKQQIDTMKLLAT